MSDSHLLERQEYSEEIAMGMGGGNTGGAVSEINVTPLIDVLLVLLIIFMVIVPVTPRGLETLVPQPPKEHHEDPVNDRTIVVQVLSNGAAAPAYKINDSAFNKTDLEPKLAEIFATRQEKVMFVKGDKDLDFSKVAEVIDFGHQAGVDNIGLITPRVEAGQ
jgi:biopolymer transport protein TolR